VVDLRSDTVTRPTPAMREAIARAEVGDDVLGDDPTVKRLEQRLVEITGHDAALFVPSGTMGNQLAVAAHTRPGDEVLLEAKSHLFLYEQGGIGANSGCLAHILNGERGALRLEDLAACLRHEDEHNAHVTLVCGENTHNYAGGVIVPLEHLRRVATFARARGIGLHLDGARLWNASVASGVPIRDWAATTDTLMMCFSKGLGAPVGSILTGRGELLARARRQRKRWGGAMRQVGILAAACLHALDHHVERLRDDHTRARALAAGFRRAAGVSVPEPETNIVMVHLEHDALDTGALEKSLTARGIGMFGFGARRLRAIVHLDVDDAGIARAIEAFHAAIEECLARGGRAPAATRGEPR